LNFQGQYMSKQPVGAGVDSFTMAIGAYAAFIGRLPEANSIRLEGAYKVNTPTATGDGVVLINGKQVLRVPAGGYPYKTQSFSKDISTYAGQYVLMEVIADGSIRGSDAAVTWGKPRIIVEN
jgi:hypothetical protein